METSVFTRHREALLDNFSTLVEMVARIDTALRDLDNYMDALQPAWESGRLRVLFVNAKGDTFPELRCMYRARSDSGWHSKRVTKGWGTRSLKRTGDFEPNYEAVKALCSAVEALLAERSHLMVRLRSLSAGFRESTKNAAKRIEKIEQQYVEPFRDALDPDRQKRA